MGDRLRILFCAFYYPPTSGGGVERTIQFSRRLPELGIESVLVTARPPRWIDPLSAIVGKHGMAICTNGAFVYDVANHRVVEQQIGRAHV